MKNRPLRNFAFLLVSLAALPFLPVACHPAASQSSSTAPVAPTVPSFDSSESYSILEDQCNFGPRVPNTAAHAQCEQYILAKLKPYVDSTVLQNFTFHDTSRNVTLHLTNILGVINPTGTDKVLLCAHWDTRPTADEDFDIDNRNKPIPGADDGASGVAVLLELAKVFHQTRPKTEVILAFWDGEDWGPDDPHMYLGADYFSSHPGILKPNKAILIDMIGNKGVSVPKEQYSQAHAGSLQDEVYLDAWNLGYSTQFPDSTGFDITDDHIPMNEAGIPTVDLIDFNYAYWHTLQDTPDKCSASSLEIIGRTLELFVYDQPA